MKVVRVLCVVFLLQLVASVLGAQPVRVLSGRVSDAESGKPVPARIEILETRAAVTANADGTFSIEAGALASATVVVSHPGFYVQRTTLDTRTAGALEVKLAPIVTVTDPSRGDGHACAGASGPSQFHERPAREGARDLLEPGPGGAAVADGARCVHVQRQRQRHRVLVLLDPRIRTGSYRVMLNGAPLNDAESGELFFIDLADFMSTAGDVQVQRGVSGLSGLGGTVDFTTASPSLRPSFQVQFGGGSYNTKRLSVMWDSGLVDGAWAFSARYSKVSTDGYRDQSWVDMWNYFSAAHYGARSRVRLVLFGGPEQTHLAYNGIDAATLNGGLTGNADRDRRYNTLTYPGEIDNFFQPHYQVVHDIAFSEQTRFSQTLYAFQGDGYYDQFRSGRSLFEYNLPNAQGPERRHQEERPRTAAHGG